MTSTATAELSGRLVVVSPHLDDAIFSLGASIKAVAGAGGDVEIVTVFAGNPESSAPAGRWDSISNFASEGEAARQRRAEDDEACSIVGAKARRLPFGDRQYASTREADAVVGALRACVSGADVALLPGYPVENEDHAWLAAALADAALPVSRLGLYVEQPYAAWKRDVPGTWRVLKTSPADQLAKLRACRAYRSQIAPLGGVRVLLGVLAFEARRGGESIRWLEQG